MPIHTTFYAYSWFLEGYYIDGADIRRKIDRGAINLRNVGQSNQSSRLDGQLLKLVCDFNFSCLVVSLRVGQSRRSVD